MDPTQAPFDGDEPRPTPTASVSTDPAGAADTSVPGPTTPPDAAPDAAASIVVEGPTTPPDAGPEAPSPQQGLLSWIAIIVAGSLACTLLGHAEGAVFFAGAGVFALAQATDAAAAFAAYRHWVRDSLPAQDASGRVFRYVVRGIVPGIGALFYVALGSYAWQLGSDRAHRLAAAWSFAAAAISLLLAARPVADRLTAWMFRLGPIGRTRRLAMRLVVLSLLLPVPMQALLPDLLNAMRATTSPLADAGALVSQLLGEIAVALAAVGWLVRRRWRETIERLGLGAVRPAHAGVILAGLAGALAINAGMEWLQHAAFPLLWRHDQEVTGLIVGHMPVSTALLLGLSAGFGEEVAFRGALQPRLGVVLTALVFACGHVQYSWFGMLTIALLGVLLGLVRRQTNTSVAIVVHGLYDIVAVLTSQH